MDFNPAPETAMHAGDDLVVLGRAGSLKDLELAALSVATGRAKV
jgi:K+/H+ antiporter YhaU regulatory subunit KhtT